MPREIIYLFFVLDTTFLVVGRKTPEEWTCKNATCLKFQTKISKFARIAKSSRALGMTHPCGLTDSGFVNERINPFTIF